MAIPVKKIEKEFFLKILYEEQIPVVYLKDRTKHLFLLIKPVSDKMNLRACRSASVLKPKEQIDLMFDYRGKVIVFTVNVLHIKDEEISCTVPDFLYKDLDRTYSRISSPQKLEIQFTFHDDRYNLSFPRVMEYESEEGDDFESFLEKVDTANLSGLIGQMGAWIKKHASDYKLVIFKDVKPSGPEECMISETGKTLFLPSTKGDFPASDPFPRKRIITRDLFKRYLESNGVKESLLDNACTRFIQDKVRSGILSDAWVPVFFQEYVIGYIHIWINTEGITPIDYKTIGTLYQFARVLSYSLKINGYFEKGKLEKEDYKGKLIDISASGLLFACPHSNLSAALMSENSITVKLITPERGISVQAAIVRRFRDQSLGYFGCRFEDIAQDDFYFLFEFIYGKPFDDTDTDFFTGQV